MEVGENIVFKLLNLLEQLVEERGVPKSKDIVNKNIIPVENSTLDNKTKKSSSTITPNERKKLLETFTLFNKMFFDYKKNVEGDKAEKTLVSKISTDQKKTTVSSEEKKGDGLGLMGLVLGGLGLFAASVVGLGAALSGIFGDMTGAVKVIGKLGFVGALKMIGKTFAKRFAIGILKKLPIIGGIIGLSFAVKAFADGDIFLGIAELISGLLNFIPVAGPFLSMGADILIAWAQGKGMFSEGGALSTANGWNTIKGWMSSIGKVIWDNALYLPIIGTFKRFGMAGDAFGAGQYGEGIKQIGLGILTLGGGGFLIKGIEILSGFLNSEKSSEPVITKDSSWGERLMGWIRSKLKDLPWYIKKPLAWFGIISDDQVGAPAEGAWASIANGAKSGFEKTKTFISDTWDKMKGPLGDSISTIKQFSSDFWEETKKSTAAAWISISEGATKVWGGIKGASEKAWDTLSSIGSWITDGISNMATKAKNMINQWIPGIVTTISNVANSAMDILKGIASKVGGWIAGLFSAEEEKKLQEVTTQQEKSQSKTIQTNTDIIKILEYNGTQERNWFNLLHDATTQQSKLLLNLITIGTESLKELKRMSGNGGGSNIIMPPSSTPQSQKQEPITLSDNRDGYYSSPYALA